MVLTESNLIKNTYSSVFGKEFPELLRLFVTNGEVKEFPKGRSLFREGEESEGFFWILEGTCKICKCLMQEGEQIIAIAGPGDFTGLTSCLNGTTYKKGCISLQRNTKALFIPKEQFFAWLEKYPSITLPLLKQIEAKIDRIENRAAYFMRKTIDQRLAHAILLLSDKYGQSADSFLKIRLSPQEFANFIGTTRTTIYRIFKRFENEKLIEMRNKRLRIVDGSGLETLARSN